MKILTKSKFILDLNLIGREDGETPITKQSYEKIVQSWITLDPLLHSWKMLPTQRFIHSENYANEILTPNDYKTKPGSYLNSVFTWEVILALRIEKFRR